MSCLKMHRFLAEFTACSSLFLAAFDLIIHQCNCRRGAAYTRTFQLLCATTTAAAAAFSCSGTRVCHRACPPLSSSCLPFTTSTARPAAIRVHRYRCRVAYDGSRFNGFQYQKNARTVQGVLEEMLSRRFPSTSSNNRTTIRVVGAGRTDAGVHAKGQAIHFDLLEQDHLKVQNELSQLQQSMNSMLPKEIVVWNVQKAPLVNVTTTSESAFQRGLHRTTTRPWHVIANANRKLYSYRLCLSGPPVMDPLDRYNRHCLDQCVDMDLLNQTLHKFQGTFDFRAFAGAIEQKEKKDGRSVSTIRTVYKVDLIKEDAAGSLNGSEDGHGETDDHGAAALQYYRIDVLLQGALYKMIRNMIGTAIDVSRGRMSVERFDQLLQEPPPPPNFCRRNDCEDDDYDDDATLTTTVTTTTTTTKNANPTTTTAAAMAATSTLGRKDNPCKPAPPQGLTLERVYYDDDDF